MSIHPTARAARDRSPRRWRPPAAALAAALLLAGGALTARGLAGPGGGPHPQPLPARLFAVSPAAAQAMAGPPALARPQPGSIQAACTRLPAGRPQIAIPSLCIYAPLVPARITGNALDIPADVHLAALDTQSAALAARAGTTIIAGHVDNTDQGDGAFYFLYQIRPGALITITGPGHATTRWRAYKTAVTAKTRLPPGIWSLTGPRRLVLVTCGGPLEHTPVGNTYRDNILIYATPASHPRTRRLPARGTAKHAPGQELAYYLCAAPARTSG